MSKTQVETSVVNICDSLLSALAQQSNVNEEIAFVQVTKASAEYWNTFNDSDWGGAIPSGEMVAVLVQADCGGYIYGWTAAIVTEIVANGHLDVNNQYKRIAAGGVMAINVSCGGTQKIATGIARWISGLW